MLANLKLSGQIKTNIIEMVEKFAAAHLESSNTVISTKGKHARQKLDELLEKIPKRLMAARFEAKRLKPFIKEPI